VVVLDISDVVLGKLIAELAAVKGNNITVILDCCNSGSGTRINNNNYDKMIPKEFQGATFQARYAPPLQPEEESILEMLSFAPNLTPTSTTTRSTPNSTTNNNSNLLRHPSATSHILLAACRPHESAQETPTIRGGIFTYALLKVLSQSSDLTSITYISLISALFPLVSGIQHPQCEGTHKRRVLFDGRDYDKGLVRVFNPGLREVEVEGGGGGCWAVEAGGINGVGRGTVLTVEAHHLKPEETSEVVVIEVYETWSIVKPVVPTKLPAGKYARVSYWANRDNPFRIGFLPSPTPNGMNERERAIREVLDRGGDDDDAIREVSDVCVVRDEVDPDVRIGVDEGGIRVERRDELVVGSGSERVFYWDRRGGGGSGGERRRGRKRIGSGMRTRSVVEDWDIISHIARFNFHLYRENPAHPFRDMISIGLYRIENDDLQGFNLLSPPSPTSALPIPTATLFTSPSTPEQHHAFLLTNHSLHTSLFCSLYYYDPTNYSISHMYSPPSSTMFPPPLACQGHLVVGHGSSGVPPFVFTVREGEGRDVGFVRVWVRERCPDLMGMEMGGLEGTEEGEEEEEGGEERGREGREEEWKRGEWDSWTVCIDVRRI
jgi:Caspase domain